MTTLRPYQRESIDAILNYWKHGEAENALLELATGTGKSVVLAQLKKELMTGYPLMRILVLVHVRELVSQNYQQLMRLWKQAPAGINSAGLGRRDFSQPIIFASVQSVYKTPERLGHRDLVLIDECFAAGTKIRTLNGSKEIQEIKVGDFVLNAFGAGVVEAVKKSKATQILNVRLSNGKKLRCTDGHKFFTEKGWKTARELEKGTVLHGEKDVRNLRESILSATMDAQSITRVEDNAMLLSGLRNRKNEAHSKDELAFETSENAKDKKTSQSKPSNTPKSMRELPWRISAKINEELSNQQILFNILLQEKREFYVGSRGKGKNDCQPKSHWTSAIAKVWKWLWLDGSSVGYSGLAGRGLDSRISGADFEGESGKRIPDLLQDRCGESGIEDSNRNRRRFTCGSSVAGGPQKGCASERIWVESISLEEPSGTQFVYDLQVGGHPSYFAEGVLVHNCHLTPHAAQGMYHKLLDGLRRINPNLRVAGCTATPYRLDSGRLDKGKERLFDRIVYSYGIAEGVRDGYLSPLVSKGMKSEINVKDVAKRGGEFIAGALEKAADQSDLVAAACDEIIKHGASRKSWLLFCSGVDHAAHVSEELVRRGISSAVVTGDTPKPERDRILNGFKAGHIRAVCNMSVLTTGFDAPNVDLIALLRPTLSTGLFVQMLGRGTRIAPGKVNCLVLDFSGNVRRHGPVDLIDVGGKSKGAGSTEVAVKVETVAAKECPVCASLVSLRTMLCPDCGHQWQSAPKHETKSDDAPVMSGRTADGFVPVRDVHYYKHVKSSGSRFAVDFAKSETPPTLRVSYGVGVQAINEWMCFSHPMGSWPQRRAVSWWLEAGGKVPAPASVDEALERSAELRTAVAVKYEKDDNGYKKIVARRYVAQKELVAA